jgi:hypothetical protein
MKEASQLRLQRSFHRPLLSLVLLLGWASGWPAAPARADELTLAATRSGPFDAIAVCPPGLQPALQSWVTRRTGEGLAVCVIAPEPTAAATKRKIADAAEPGRTRYVLLVGDTQLSPDGRAIDARYFVPTIYQQADATAPWQAVPQLPGDYQYGDFDDDGLVNAAVGRLPVQTLDQAKALFARIAAYEDSRDFGNWRSRVDLVAGMGGFGPLIDGAIETITSGIITGYLPGAVRTRVTHAGPDSLFFPGSDRFTDTVLANYADGSRFWVYAGHGHIRELDRVPATQFGRPVLAVDDVERLRRSADGAPIALLLACYTGAFDATEDCLAKQMLLTPGGPIAVLAGSRVTMPYGNAAAAMGLIHSVYHRKPERLGDAWRETLVEMATPSDAEPGLQSRRMVIDSLAQLLGGGRIDEERREHMQLYNWLGDPTMRLTHPEELQIDPVAGVTAGQTLMVTGTSPLRGTLTVELHRRLGTPATSAIHELAGEAAGQRTPYELANDTVIGDWSVALRQSGQWKLPVTFPTGVSGPMQLVVRLQGDDGFASGAQNIWIRPEH